MYKVIKQDNNYIVLNIKNNTVQSIWATLLQARNVARNLNNWSKHYV